MPGGGGGTVSASQYTTSGSLATLFNTETGQTANTTCAVYAMTSLGSTLYFGVSNQPATYDGGVVASTTNGTSLTPHISVDEQGIHDMHTANSLIWIPGTDETLGAAGNIYTNHGGSWVKRTTLTNAIHVWGLYGDDTELFATTGQSGFTGRIFRSTNAGVSWGDTYDISGTYRIYDFQIIGSRWWVITTSSGDSSPRVRYSDNSGSTWNVLGTDDRELPDRLQRLVVVGTDLYYINQYKNRLYKVTSSLTKSYMSIIGREWGYPEFNGLVHDGTYFYWLDNGGYIWRTPTNWSSLEQFSYVENGISLYYWASDSSLIVSDIGSSPNLWRIPIT